jgi:hypothetical protein
VYFIVDLFVVLCLIVVVFVYYYRGVVDLFRGFCRGLPVFSSLMIVA